MTQSYFLLKTYRIRISQAYAETADAQGSVASGAVSVKSDQTASLCPRVQRGGQAPHLVPRAKRTKK
jgi:hypothetical protein